MKDINTFLNWYFGVRTCLGRAAFNIILFFLTLPTLFLGLLDASQTVSGVTEKGVNVMQLINTFTQAAQGAQTIQETQKTPNQVLNQYRAQKDLIEKDLRAYHQKTHEQNTQPYEKSELFSKYINALIYLLMIPLVRMRLRDAGVWFGIHHWGLLTLAYAPFILNTLMLYSAYTPSKTVFFIIHAFSFIAFLWICTKNSTSRSSVRKNYMPGDSPNDPY